MWLSIFRYGCPYAHDVVHMPIQMNACPWIRMAWFHVKESMWLSIFRPGCPFADLVVHSLILMNAYLWIRMERFCDKQNMWLFICRSDCPFADHDIMTNVCTWIWMARFCKKICDCPFDHPIVHLLREFQEICYNSISWLLIYKLPFSYLTK